MLELSASLSSPVVARSRSHGRPGPTAGASRGLSSPAPRAARVLEQQLSGSMHVQAATKRRSVSTAGGPQLKRLRHGAAVTAAAAVAAPTSPGPSKTDTKTLLRKVLRLVHPDKYMSNPSAQEVNSQSLKARGPAIRSTSVLVGARIQRPGPAAARSC